VRQVEGQLRNVDDMTHFLKYLRATVTAFHHSLADPVHSSNARLKKLELQHSFEKTMTLFTRLQARSRQMTDLPAIPSGRVLESPLAELELEVQEVYDHHERVRDTTTRALRFFDLEYRTTFPFWSRGVDLYKEGPPPPPLEQIEAVISSTVTPPQSIVRQLSDSRTPLPQLQVICSTTFCAVVGLSVGDRGYLEVYHVVVGGVDEVMDLSLWGQSKHAVFRDVTEHACAACAYFQQNYVNEVLRRFLAWLFHYRTLFTEACKGCKRLLDVGGEDKKYLPPSFRDFRLGTAYHKHCYVEIASS